jgi:hypothetical protein
MATPLLTGGKPTHVVVAKLVPVRQLAERGERQLIHRLGQTLQRLSNFEELALAGLGRRGRGYCTFGSYEHAKDRPRLRGFALLRQGLRRCRFEL